MSRDLSEVIDGMHEAETKINKEAKATPEKVAAPVEVEVPTPVPPVAMPDGGVVTPQKIKAAQDKKVVPESPKALTIQEISALRDEEVIMSLKTFVENCGAMAIISPNSPNEHRYPKAEAWKYLAALKDCHTRIVHVDQKSLPCNPAEFMVIATCELVEDKTDKVLTTVKMSASTTEKFVAVSNKDSKEQTVYALAITRAESRAVRGVYGHLMAMTRVDMTPAEEISQAEINLEEV